MAKTTSTGRTRVEPRTSDAAVQKATGTSRAAWFLELDRWGAKDRSHRDIAAWLIREMGVPGWWAQTLTVDYEHARGLRPRGGHRDGTFSIGASKTMDVPVAQAFDAVVDARRRRRWLPDANPRLRTSLPGRTARFDWDDGATRVVVGFAVKDRGRSVVHVQHERLTSAAVAKKRQAYWREKLTALATSLGRGRRD